MFLKTGPGPGGAGNKHFYYGDTYFCYAHGTRPAQESDPKLSALQPAHSKNSTVCGTHHTPHDTQIVKLAFPSLAHLHRLGFSKPSPPQAFPTQADTKRRQ